ncbi:MAG TPA: hypothetical protein VJH03_19520 [Blastocatellia bacterium]|nr:hypothetical protein [Blastocatellia bacterium]
MQKKISVPITILFFTAIVLTAVFTESHTVLPGNAARVEEPGDDVSGMKEPANLRELRAEYFFEQRAYPFDEVPADWQLKAVEHLRARERGRQSAGNALQSVSPLTPIGPDRITVPGAGPFSGRVTALVTDPQDRATVYVGAAGGGVWRSTDSGVTWQPIIESAPTQMVGAIAVDPSDRNTIYVGTGDGLQAATSFSSMGILKSTDAGQTWTTLASDVFLGLGFNVLIVDPRAPQTLYAALGPSTGGIARVRPVEDVNNGIYKSTDAGVSWVRVLPGSTLFDTPFDLAMHPSNSSILFAAFDQGFFKTTDGGQSWAKLAGGIPASNTNHPQLAIAETSPNIVYAAFYEPQNNFLLKAFKTTDGGDSWAAIRSPSNPEFAGLLKVNPANPDIVYFGGYSLYRSTNGGNTWSVSPGLHVDYTSMAFVAGDPTRCYVANDGGVWLSTDSGQSYVNRNTNLAVTQFYSVAMHPTDPNITIGGTQDNGTDLFTGAGNWQLVFGGDGGFTAIDQTTPDNMYTVVLTADSQGRLVRSPVRSVSGGQFGTWRLMNNGIDSTDNMLLYPPLALDPNNQSTLFYGTSRLYASNNQGESWTPLTNRLVAPDSVISAIAVARGAANVIYFGSFGGSVFATQDARAGFSNVTGNLPRRFISRIVVDRSSPSTVYVALSGFHSGHVFKSETGGGDWQDISGNLPDVPANALAVNPINARNIFVGTDIGLFATEDDGATWELVPGMPSVPVLDIALNVRLGLLRVATHGRGMYEARVDNTATNFALEFEPAEVTVSRGQTVRPVLQVNRVGGFSGGVTLSAPSTSGLKLKLSPREVSTVGSSVQFKIKVKGKSPLGPHELVFTGRDELGRTSTARLTLVINP